MEATKNILNFNSLYKARVTFLTELVLQVLRINQCIGILNYNKRKNSKDIKVR